MEDYERLKALLKKEDDEIDERRLKDLARQLRLKPEDVEAILKGLGYGWNALFGFWKIRPQGSRLRQLLDSIFKH